MTLSLLNGLHHHNYGINSVGINTRSETPTILSQHPYSNPLLTNFNNNNNNNKRNNKSESDADKKRNDVPSSSTNSTPGPGPAKSDSDIQFIAEVKYEGDLHLEINVNLLVNYPSPNFITLPINLHVTDLNIHSIMAIAYLKKSVFLTFLCDIDEISVDYFNTNHNTGGNFVDYVSGSQQERIDIIKRVRIESEIGEVEQNVLRNVGKVEKFLVEQLRSILRDEVAWPSWVCVDLNGEDDE